MKSLPPIPLIDLAGGDFATLIDHHRDRVRIILDAARRSYTQPLIHFGDRLSRTWAARAGIPYRQEIAAIDAAVGRSGAWMLNLSYEWGCTTASLHDPSDSPRMVRTLDWGLRGLGGSLIAVRRLSAAGEWINLTWPGFVGVVQGVARGRFAAAINQAPVPNTGFGRWLDWMAARLAVWRGMRVPPVLLLRTVFEEAHDFAEAKAMLQATPVSLPVLFTLVGCRPGESAVIERLPDHAVVHDGRTAVTNHWLSAHLPGRSRSFRTAERLAAIQTRLRERIEDFAWLVPPILNPDTRLAMEADPARGSLRVRGYEGEIPATAVLDIEG